MIIALIIVIPMNRITDVSSYAEILKILIKIKYIWTFQKLRIKKIIYCYPDAHHASRLVHSAVLHTNILIKNLLTEFGRLVIAIRPAYILVENVPGLKGRGEAVFKKFIDQLSINGYMFAYRVVNAKDYGVPQNRKRLVIVASRLFQPIIPEGLYGKDKLPYRTVRDAIAHYPPIEAGGVDNTFYNHSSSTLSPLNMARIEATPHSGGDRRAWPGNLVLACHNDHDGHTDVYGRMFWDQVSPALTARCYSLSNGRYGHPEQNRAISLREAAALQSFPDDYIFYGNTMSVGRQIGNAVPVKLAEELARYIVHMSRNAQLEMY